MAKRGRPINWEKAYKTYQKTVNYYTEKLGTTKNDWYVSDIDAFKEKVTSQRDINKKWSVAKTVSYYAQKSSLNGVTINQINELRTVGTEFGENISFSKAVKIFRSAATEDLRDIKDFVKDNGWWDEDDYQLSMENLSGAVMRGELTISEMYKFLISVGIPDAKERGKLISQNIFGSD